MNADLLLTFYIYRRRRPIQNADTDEHFLLSAAFYPNKIFHKSKRPQHHEHSLWKAALYVPLKFFFSASQDKISLFVESLQVQLTFKCQLGKPQRGTNGEELGRGLQRKTQLTQRSSTFILPSYTLTYTFTSK